MVTVVQCYIQHNEFPATAANTVVVYGGYQVPATSTTRPMTIWVICSEVTTGDTQRLRNFWKGLEAKNDPCNVSAKYRYMIECTK